MSGVTVTPVASKRERKEFVDLAYRLNAGDPHWVPPLKADVAEMLDPARNPFFEHAEVQLFLARREIDACDVGVIALGRWGGYEMSYSSDADCMFVVPDGVEPEEITKATALVRRAAEIVGKPGPDPALVIDSDLRPEGKGGPQVRTVGSYTAYYDKWASTWEAQMLLRARPGAGNRPGAARGQRGRGRD